MRKALNSLEDLRTGVVSGLSILPGTDEFPKGSDVVVQARIYRGTQQAWVEYENADGQRVKEAMRLDGDESKVQYDIQKAVPSKDSSYTLLHTEMPHGLSDGQAVELSGTGWADGITEQPSMMNILYQYEPTTKCWAWWSDASCPCTCLLLTAWMLHRLIALSLPIDREWHQITTYIPPRIDKVRWKVTPPAYTRWMSSNKKAIKPSSSQRAV